MAKAAKSAFTSSQLIDASERVKALQLMKEELERLKSAIRRSNEEDMQVEHFCYLLALLCADLRKFRLHKQRLPPAGSLLRL